MQKVYSKLALLFQYPDEEYRAQTVRCTEQMQDISAEAASHLNRFCAAIHDMSTDQLQELFTRAFDLNPACSLDIGWHLFGEEYQRGEFLVKMRHELRESGLEESSELPDHMTHALALLARMDDAEAAQFAGQFLLPALHKMREAWKTDADPFRSLLEALFALLASRYSYEPPQTAVRVPQLNVLQ
jgi:nitrate reductase molybdenum cofactor assembly chaperone NarJ/NarW